MNKKKLLLSDIVFGDGIEDILDGGHKLGREDNG
jgi:hypothetical protein